MTVFLSQSEKLSEIKPPLRISRIFQQTLLVNSMWIIVVCSTSLINGFPSSSLKYTMIDARAFRFSFPVSQWIKVFYKAALFSCDNSSYFILKSKTNTCLSKTLPRFLDLILKWYLALKFNLCSCPVLNAHYLQTDRNNINTYTVFP